MDAVSCYGVLRRRLFGQQVSVRNQRCTVAFMRVSVAEKFVGSPC